MSTTEFLEGNEIKRRKSGEGSEKNVQKKLRSEGKSYINNKKQNVLAKQPPPDEVGLT